MVNAKLQRLHEWYLAKRHPIRALWIDGLLRHDANIRFEVACRGQAWLYAHDEDTLELMLLGQLFKGPHVLLKIEGEGR